MDKKKILLMSGHSRSAFKWGMVGEVAKRLLEDDTLDVYYLDCNNCISTPCGLNPKKHWGYCKKCSDVCLKILKQTGFKDENILKMQRFSSPKFDDIKNIQDAIDFEYEGYNYGLGPASCIMTLTRDYSFDIKKWQKTLKGYLATEYTVFKNIEKFNDIYHFDEIHTFNGRMPVIYPCVSFAKKHNIPYVVYERGANINKLRVIKNNVPHDFNYLKDDIAYYWQNASENKVELAEKWFTDRRGGSYQAIESFTKKQVTDRLPVGFDTNKENIAIFNSSIDEVYAFDSWKHPFADTENVVIEALFEHYKDDDSKHFYLRIHPNLTKAKKNKTTQMREINEFKKKYRNLTVIEPDEKIDTYALIEACNKTVTSYSTVGFEATYWGAVSIFAGKAPYEDLNCAYQALSLDLLYNLIDNKELKPKPKENTYPYAYFNQVYGDDYKYFKAINHYEGYFMGMQLKSR